MNGDLPEKDLSHARQTTNCYSTATENNRSNSNLHQSQKRFSNECKTGSDSIASAAAKSPYNLASFKLHSIDYSTSLSNRHQVHQAYSSQFENQNVRFQICLMF